MANKCVKELVDLLMYSRFTPACFEKWLSSSGGVGALETTQAMSVLWAYTDYDNNHLPKHVGVNVEYINKSTSFLTHLLVILQRHYKNAWSNNNAAALQWRTEVG
jgi:hypothetical protein